MTRSSPAPAASAGSCKPGTPTPQSTSALRAQALRQAAAALQAQALRQTATALHQLAPSPHARLARRLPPPRLRAGVDPGRLTVAPALALKLATASPQPQRACHLLLRAQRDDAGQVTAWKLAAALLAAGLCVPGKRR